MRLIAITIVILVVYVFILVAAIEFKPPLTTTDKAEVRAFIKDCDGHVLIKETDAVFELRCNK